MERRKKASDVFADTTYLFAKKASFQEVFPELEEARVEVEETGEGVYERSRRSVLSSKTHLSEFVNCSNPLCYNGGVSIGSIIRSMVAQKQTELETTKLCQGYEGSPKGRRKYRQCFNFFTVKVALTYK
jgi:hypothetical protein